MKRIVFFIFFAAFLWTGFTQTVNTFSLEECYESAINTHPLQAKGALLSQSQQIKVDKLDKTRMPTLDWNTQASIQTETVSLPFEGPGIPALDLATLSIPVHIGCRLYHL